MIPIKDEKTLDMNVVQLETDGGTLPAHSETETIEEPQHFKWDYHLISNLLTLCFIIFCGSWSSGVPGSAIAFIAQRFPDEANNSAWIATAPFICGAVVLSFIGDLSDIFGRKKFLLFSCGFIFIGQLISARAGTLAQVIGGQVINGIGLGIGFLSNPLIAEIVPKIQRPYATAIATFVSSFSYIGGPILEGLFIQNEVGGELEGWRVGFYLGAGFASIAFTLLVIFYHPMPRPNPEGQTVMQQLKKIDVLGIFLASTGLILFLVGINYGGNPFAWSSAIVLGPMVAGIVLIFAFIGWVWKGTSTGVIPHIIFEDRNFTITLVVRVIGGFALFGCQAFLPQMVVFVFGKGGLTTALWTLTFNIFTVLGAFLAAFLLRTIKEVKYIVIGLILALTLGAGLLIVVKPGVSFAVWFFASFFMGLAIGSEASTLTIIAGLTVPNEFIATGVCIGVSGTYVGGALATTMYGQIFQAKSKDLVPAAIASAALLASLPQDSVVSFVTAFLSGNAEGLAAIPGVSPTMLAAATLASQEAYAKVFNFIWYTLIAWCGASIGLAFFYGSTKKYMTMEVSAPVQRAVKEVQAEP